MKISSPSVSTSETVGIRVKGTVQGVGFRPFVYRLARENGVEGWVRNDMDGVLIQASAPPETLLRFESELTAGAPPAAKIECIHRIIIPEDPAARRSEGFRIIPSREGVKVDVPMPPDLALCNDCRREMNDPMNRRYRYPFINCTNCGPRYSILEEIPYDRQNTTMRGFTLCQACRTEFENPEDRRFHAQPIACPECGPHLNFLGRDGKRMAEREEALTMAIDQLREGRILAVKGIGGFQLMCDAASEDSVKALRERKRREEKPLALMVPDLGVARQLCDLLPEEEDLLQSVQAPIVLAVRLAEPEVLLSAAVAPDNPLIGLMLPYSPLHRLLLDSFGGVLVATSGNLSEEPICIDENEALERLGGIADGFLVHNRSIARGVDDSVVRVMMGEPVVFRRARGYAPAPLVLKEKLPSLLAVGAQLKNTIAVSCGHHIFPSQHVGDLSTAAACHSFAGSIETLAQLYRTEPAAVVCDMHPDYHSTLWAERCGLPVVAVQHHFAHVLSGMADNQLEGPVLGVSWDGTGYGTDGSIWGGEWLLVPCGGKDFERVGHLLPFRLPGGEAAIRRPALTGLGLMVIAYGTDAYSMEEVRSVLHLGDHELPVLERTISRGLNSPVTTSAGRLFDGVAALLGLGNRVAYEAQAAMKLEFLAMTSREEGCYDFHLKELKHEGEVRPPRVFDWTDLLRQILDDLRRGVAKSAIARRFHTTLAAGIVAMAREMPPYPVLLTGGCFQNKLLTEGTIARARENGLNVYWHHSIPPNDGGIAVGQILAASARTNIQKSNHSDVSSGSR